ncbi:hypothetical protein HPB50_008417 [Hyalomma asiaticum]|uniref:Uncharacterized protein n=1 Tax=Hyalomma asiaticum TaxID=266040 RepID=A0ACB7RN12_HYAAI|nr:hypothetical protein HPB50_008417 [Hyalomma asiaticum]
MEEKSSDEDSSNLENQSSSPNGDEVNRARAASRASTSVSPSPQPNREIVLVLKPPEAPNNHQGPDQVDPPAPEPQFRASSSETQMPPDEKFCIRIWVLWAALTCPLIFAMWLFLVPFMVSTSSKSTTPVPPSVTTAMVSCTKPVTLAAPKPPIRINPHPDRGPSKQPVRPFFCLFRNTAVTFSRNYSTVSGNYDYTFWTVPFDLCHYVIYWSVAIDNGNINSRMPHFDQHHGLYQMRNITDSLGFPNVKLLLALGGYAEDSPHFSILGREPAILNRLTANIVDAMTSLRLDGVAVHWVDPGAQCRGPDDQETVAALLRMLRQAFDSNKLTQAIVTAMLDGDRPMERLVFTSKDAVKYFFLTADRRTLSSGSKVLFEVCSALSDTIIQRMTHYIDSVPGCGGTRYAQQNRWPPWLLTGTST